MHRRLLRGAACLGVLMLSLTGATPSSAITPYLSAAFLAFQASYQPSDGSAGDFNHDGRIDAVTTDGSGSVTVLLNQGNGLFGIGKSYKTGSITRGIVVADFNGDGRDDIAVTEMYFQRITVLLSNPDGTMNPPINTPTIQDPARLVAGDLNGDGKADLVILSDFNDEVAVMLGNGDGTFQPPTEIALAAEPYSLTLGDLNGDHRLDVLVAEPFSNTLAIFLGNGDGTLGAEKDLNAGLAPAWTAIGDWNGDQEADVAVAMAQEDSVAIFPGVGDGTFGPRKAFFAGQGPIAIASADLNGDGKPDLATLDAEDGTVATLLGHGDGSYSLAKTCKAGGGVASLNLGRVDEDPYPDAMVAGGSGESVLFNNGDGTLGEGRDFATGVSPSAVAVGDINGDNAPDLAVTNSDPSSNSVSILLGNGSGSFGAKTDFPVGARPVSVVLADFDHNGTLDLATANEDANTISVLLGDGTGSFGQKHDFSAGSSPTSIACGDFNKDGRPDLVVTNLFSNTITVLLGNGDGTFGAGVAYATSNNPQAVAVGDLNGDGNLDLVTASTDYNRFPATLMSVFLGHGDGTFAAKADYVPSLAPQAAPVRPTSIPRPLSVAIGDLNSDSHPDVVVGSDFGITAYFGNGAGNFSASQSLSAIEFPVSVAIGDIDGDGRADILVAGTGSVVSLIRGHGGGTFEPQLDFGTGAGSNCVTLADVNRDHQLDVVVSNGNENTVSVLLNRNQATPALASAMSAVALAGSIRVTWFMADGSGTSAKVQRSEPGGDWNAIGTVSPDAQGYLVYEDRSVVPAHNYGYRLEISGVIMGEIWASVPVSAAFTLGGFEQNPSPRDGTIAFSLASAEPATLELIDVKGRIVWTRAVGALGPGSHAVKLGTGVALGIYVVRLTQGARAVSTRGVVIGR